MKAQNNKSLKKSTVFIFKNIKNQAQTNFVPTSGTVLMTRSSLSETAPDII